MHHHWSYAKPSTAFVTGTSPTNVIQPEKAQLVSPQQNNIFHEFARKNGLVLNLTGTNRM